MYVFYSLFLPETSPASRRADLDGPRRPLQDCRIDRRTIIAGPATAQSIKSISPFALGTAVSATEPDSITVGGGFVWVSYTVTTANDGR